MHLFILEPNNTIYCVVHDGDVYTQECARARSDRERQRDDGWMASEPDRQTTDEERDTRVARARARTTRGREREERERAKEEPLVEEEKERERDSRDTRRSLSLVATFREKRVIRDTTRGKVYLSARRTDRQTETDR